MNPIDYRGLFINTRPAERAGRILSTEMAWQEVYLPLLALTPCPLTDVLKQQLHQLYQSDVIVVVSPTAVEIGVRYVQQLGILLDSLTHIHWVAVGQRTANVLADYGIMAETPAMETSEGMFQLPIFSAERLAQLKKVSFWRGQGGREWLMQQLHSAHLQVENCVLYQRHLPEQSVKTWQANVSDYHQYPMRVVLISSLESWNNWVQLNLAYPLELFYYLVLGKRVYQAILQHYPRLEQQVYMISSLHAESIQQEMIQLEKKVRL